jgi:hypothetical protein
MNELITRSSLARLLGQNARIKALDNLPIAAVLINGSKRIPLYSAEIILNIRFQRIVQEQIAKSYRRLAWILTIKASVSNSSALLWP